MTQHPLPHIRGYERLRSFKKGGMGTIYQGYEEATGKKVVIKLMDLPEGTQDYAIALRRFTQETDIAKFVGITPSDHVLAAINHGDTALPDFNHPIPYLVYPYIKDGSLFDLLNAEKPWHNSSWSLLQMSNIILQAAHGLTVLHNIKIVHQDVKPQNFLQSPAALVTPSHRIHLWLIDFGISAWEKPPSDVISPIGTPAYMAPEQLRGQIRRSADQYSLAVMARLLLTGKVPPIEADEAHLPSLPLTQLNTRLTSPEIDRVVLKALAYRPEERFSTVLEFAQALQEAVQQQEQPSFYTARTLLLTQQPHNNTNFHQAITEEETLAPQPQPEIHFAPLSVPAQPVEVVSSPPSAQSIMPIFIPQIPVFKTHQPLNEAIQRVTPTNPVKPPKAQSLPRFPLQRLFTQTLPSRPTMLAWSPDDTTLVCTFHEDAPWLIDNHQNVEPLTAFAYGHCACWSPDNRFLAISTYDSFRAKSSVHFWNRTDPKAHYSSLPFDKTAIYGLDWSSTGQLAVWFEAELFLYDVSALTPHTQIVPFHNIPLPTMYSHERTSLRWSPNGSSLAAGGSNGQVIIYDTQLAKVQPTTKSVQSLSWSLDSTLLAVALTDKQVIIWDRQTGNIYPSWQYLPETPTMLSISAQADLFAVSTNKALYLGNIKASAPTAMHTGQRLVAWSPTNKLATLDVNDDTLLTVWQA